MNETYSQLLAQVQDPVAKTKVAETTQNFIRDRLRESSFAESIVRPVDAPRERLLPSTNHDSVFIMENVEPRSRAMVVTPRSTNQARFIRGPRVEVPFSTIMTEIFQKTELELLAYNYPFTEVVKSNSVKDLGEVQDREWLIYSEACVQGFQVEANGGVATALNAASLAAGTVVESSITKGEGARLATSATGTAALSAVYAVQKTDIIAGMNMLVDRRLKCATILMTEKDMNRLAAWTMEDAMSMVEETTRRGWTSSELLGKKLVATLKVDILRPGNVYFYTDESFLGRFYILNKTRFWIDKTMNVLKFCAWRDIAMAIINAASVVKLELYAGDTATSVDNISANVSPVAEANLGLPNNRVSSGGVYPNVAHY